MRLFAGVLWRGGVKRQWGDRKRRFSEILDAAHTPNGDGVPPKNFGRTCRIGLKIQGVSAYNFGTSGSNVTKLFHATCRVAGVFKLALLLGKARPLKFGRAKNV